MTCARCVKIAGQFFIKQNRTEGLQRYVLIAKGLKKLSSLGKKLNGTDKEVLILCKT